MYAPDVMQGHFNDTKACRSPGMKRSQRGPARYGVFQVAGVPVPKRLFATILERIRRLRLLMPAPG